MAGIVVSGIIGLVTATEDFGRHALVVLERGKGIGYLAVRLQLPEAHCCLSDGVTLVPLDHTHWQASLASCDLLKQVQLSSSSTLRASCPSLLAKGHLSGEGYQASAPP